MQNETIGWVKSIHETRYGELLGIVMVGPHVTDLIEAGVVAIDAEATVETVADGMAAHPTLSEAIKEAGLVALERAIHLPPRRRAKATAYASTGSQSRYPDRGVCRSVGNGDGRT
jgi:dihydrolipoamide dehydrogenase